MQALGELWRRVKFLFQRDEFHRELEEEMQHHLEMSARAHTQTGELLEEARFAAEREMGNALRLREESREVWGWTTLEGFAQDLRYASRQWRRNPGFTVVAALSLSLGIGANTAIFTMMDAVLWKTLPVNNPQQLAEIQSYSPTQHRTRDFPTAVLPEFLAEGHNYGFEGILGHVEDGLSLDVDGHAERVMGDVVTPNFFAVLGVKPFLGQMFSENVLRGDWQPEIVFPYDFWKRRFDSDPSVVGRTVHLNGYAFTVVGISPPGFFGVDVGISPEVRIPMLMNGMRTMPALPLLDPSSESYWGMMARLKPGVSRRQAQAAADTFFQHVLHSGRRVNQDLHIRVSEGSHGSSLLRDYERPLLILMWLVGLVLLLACANIANLLLGRAVARQREVATRLALGAGRSRLIRQLLTESILLSLSGGILGVLFSLWGTQLMFSFLPQTNVALSLDLQPDLRSLAFTFAVAVTSGIVFGLAPAFRLTRSHLTPALKGNAPVAVKGRLHFELRDILMASQVAISMLLLVGAGLFIRSLENLRSINPGFSPDHIVLFTMKHVHERYTPDQVTNFCRELIERVDALPGVRSAGLTEGTGPFRGNYGRIPVSIAGGAAPEESAQGLAVEVSPGFFRTFEISFLVGLDFSFADADPKHKVAIVNDVVVRDPFENKNPIGRRLHLSSWGEFDIVGVVRGVKYASLKDQIPPEVFVPMQGIPWMPALEVRTSGDPNSLIQPVLRVFRQLDKDLPLFNIKTMDTQNESLAPERLVAMLAGFFGVLAELLASIGLYGVMAYAVARRTHEIGIRMALGAQRGEVLAMVLREVLLLVAVGLGIGTLAALAAGRLISAQLYGLKAADTETFTVAALGLASVAALASYLPALRASRVDPMVALRYE